MDAQTKPAELEFADASGTALSPEDDTKAKPAELSDEDKLDQLEFAVARQSLHREIFYKTLVYCQTQRLLSEVEGFIQSLPQFEQATLSPYHLIQTLVKHFGLEQILLDEEGCAIEPARLEGLSEDETDDLVAAQAYVTTEIGQKTIQIHLPSRRISELMTEEASREDAYARLIAFCAEEKRSYNEISTLLEGDDVLQSSLDGREQEIQPSVLVDKLQRVGALQWEKGWIATEDGKEFLKGRS